MQESSEIAYSYVRSRLAGEKSGENYFDDHFIHLHVPAGATPKDGPSAGITMLTSLASAFTQRKIKRKLAMTGEITLRGKVLPVGGIKEKILAAKRAGITDIILSADNLKDIEEIKAHYISGLKFHYVREMIDVIKIALLTEKVKNPIKFGLPKPVAELKNK